jgi:hypothetical protein
MEPLCFSETLIHIYQSVNMSKNLWCIITCKGGGPAPTAVLSAFLIFLIKVWSWLNKQKHVAYFILLCMLCAPVLSKKVFICKCCETLQASWKKLSVWHHVMFHKVFAIKRHNVTHLIVSENSVSCLSIEAVTCFVRNGLLSGALTKMCAE